MSMSYSWPQIIKAVKIFLWKSRGLGRTLLRRCYRITIFWYAKLAPTKRKCFIACDCISSKPDNLYAIYKSRHKNGNAFRARALDSIICMSKRGMWRIEPNFWHGLRYCGNTQFTQNFRFESKRNVQHNSNHTRAFPRKLSANGRAMWHNAYKSPLRKLCGNEIGTA